MAEDNTAAPQDTGESGLLPSTRRSTLPFGHSRGLFIIHADIVEPMPAEWFEKDGDDEDDLF